MIDKLEVGVKYKLVDKAGYVNSNNRNAELLAAHLNDNGCFTFDCIDKYDNGVIGDDIVIDVSENEHLFLSKVEDADLEYRVIRKDSKHQVCDWRKGVKLYEDEFGTLVRNDKRTKFYTDIVEWREVVIPVAPTVSVDLVSQLDTLSKPELEDLLIRLLDMTTATINNKDK
jgi:hypothetical protein